MGNLRTAPVVAAVDRSERAGSYQQRMSSSVDKSFDSLETAVNALAAGRLIIVTDDEERENEGDLVLAATTATPETVNFMIRHARGLICVPMLDQRLHRLGISDMVPENRESFRTAFTVSVDATHGITTGISAFDRTQTILALASPETRPDDLVQPGHIFPLRAKPGGVLERAGHTEAAIDLLGMAGMEPCAVICEILAEDGSMARLPDLRKMKEAHGLPMVSVAQLIEYRLGRERLVDRLESRPFTCPHGEFTLHRYRSRSDGRLHNALTMGELNEQPVLVRVQVEHLLSDVFQEEGASGHRSIENALRQISAAGQGALVYLQGDRTHPGISHVVEDAVASNDRQLRHYGIGAQILGDLGLRKIRLLTSRKKKLVALQSYGLEIVEHVPLEG